LEEIHIEDKGAHIYITQCFSGKAWKQLAISLMLIWYFTWRFFFANFATQTNMLRFGLLQQHYKYNRSVFFLRERAHHMQRVFSYFFNNQVWIVKYWFWY
jgi:hypothetical protein